MKRFDISPSSSRFGIPFLWDVITVITSHIYPTPQALIQHKGYQAGLSKNFLLQFYTKGGKHVKMWIRDLFRSMCTKSDTYTGVWLKMQKSTEEQARKKAVGPALHEVGGSFCRSLSSFWILFDAISPFLCPPISQKKKKKTRYKKQAIKFCHEKLPPISLGKKKERNKPA